MDGTQDISKIISIIMENPDIIEKIKSLADENGKSTDASSNNDPPAVSVQESEAKSEAVSASGSTYDKTTSKRRRRELLCALKPYVKSERAKAIDTMLSVIDVLDVMKVR